MTTTIIGRARDRSVLGSINDFALVYELRAIRPVPEDLDAWNWQLSNTPCGPLRYEYPCDVAARLFEAV